MALGEIMNEDNEDTLAAMGIEAGSASSDREQVSTSRTSSESTVTLAIWSTAASGDSPLAEPSASAASGATVASTTDCVAMTVRATASSTVAGAITVGIIVATYAEPSDPDATTCESAAVHVASSSSDDHAVYGFAGDGDQSTARCYCGSAAPKRNGYRCGARC